MNYQSLEIRHITRYMSKRSHIYRMRRINAKMPRLFRANNVLLMAIAEWNKKLEFVSMQ
jgi:hypothetical protein